MAAVAQAAALTRAHRLAQLRLGAAGARQMFAAWPLLDLEDIDGSFQRWLRVVVRLAQAQRDASSGLAAGYYRQFRAIEAAGAPPFVPLLAPELDVNALTGALVITGPAGLKRSLRTGVPLATAAELAQVETARASMRYVLDGGRTTITRSVAADPRSIGWARVASGSACAFCAMLASRGPVYSAGSVDFEAHKGCGCGAEPVFRQDAEWPPNARDYKQMWSDSGAQGPDALNTFRRHLAAGR